MKRILIFSTVLIMLTLPLMAQDDGMPMPENEEQFNRLVSLRVTSVLIDMGLSATSDTGAALMELLREDAEELRTFHMTRRSLLQLISTADAGELANLVTRLEETTLAHHDVRKGFTERLGALLSVDQRAKYYLAEEKFRRTLQRMLGERQRPGGPPRRR